MKKNIFILLISFLWINYGKAQICNGVDEDGSASGSYIPKWLKQCSAAPNDWLLTLSQIYDNGINVGIGLTGPQSYLHQHVNAKENWHQFTNTTTGNASGFVGFKLGIRYDNPTGHSFAELRQYENAPIAFYTNDANGLTPERMHIFNGNGWNPGGSPTANATKVSISYASNTAPFLSKNKIVHDVAILNLGCDPITTIGTPVGQRPWMDVGTFGCFGSDYYYMGIKSEGEDQNDAVIAWGDNYDNYDNQPVKDYLRFVFGSANQPAAGQANLPDGLEVGRFTPQGHFGIGNFTSATNGNGSGQEPTRMLEVYDPSIVNPSVTPASVPAPQLRLTFTPSSFPPFGTEVFGTWTDFQTTNLGDLYIHPHSFNTSPPSSEARRVGINISTPGNTLEINSGHTQSENLPVPLFPACTYSGSQTTRSGLRFTNLTDAMLPDCAQNANGTVLSVNDKGDVILVNQCCKTTTMDADNGLVYLPGGDADCINNPNPHIELGGNLKTRTNINMYDGCTSANNNYTLTLQGQNSGDQIVFSDYGVNLPGNNNGISSSINEDNAFNVAVSGGATGNTGPYYNIGGGFSASGGNNNYAVVGNGPYTLCSANMTLPATVTPFDIGGLFCSTDQATTGTHIGVKAVACGMHADAQVGLYAFCDGTAINPFNNWAGYFDGDVYVNAYTYSTSGWVTSDKRFKKNIDTVGRALNLISQLKPRTYYFDTNNPYGMRFGKEKQYGLIAQEVEEVLPDIVKDVDRKECKDDAGNVTWQAIKYKALNYIELIPILIKGIQEQQAQIDSMSKLLANVTSTTTGTNLNQSGNAIDVTLSSKSIVLNQNQPNPFKEQTTITYFIPDNAKDVKIIFTDAKGNIMKEVSIPEKGKGQLNVYAEDLSSGIYTYTLVADGVSIDTKKMVCNK